MWRVRILALSLVLVAVAGTGSAAPPTDFEAQLVRAAISQPMGMVFLPDGRMLLIRKSGVIEIGDPSVPAPAPFATYMTLPNINSGQERGLIDITLDPDFEINGWFYVYYTPNTPQRARIARFTHQENAGELTSTGDFNSEVVLWEDNDGYISCCHYGGGLDFGPDGRLYLTTGDKFDGLIAQDLYRAGGKVIRINKDGSIPADNFGLTEDGPGGILDEIWAYGLRNPFRARWDVPSDRFFIGEVGGNTQSISWEDVHLGRANVNYGWPMCEGPCDNPSFPGCTCALHDDPVFAYPHAGSGASVTGGVVYRGTGFPADPYYGAYFYGDFSRRWIRYLTFDPADPGIVTGDFQFEPDAGPVVAIEEGPDGALYWLTIAGSAASQGDGDLRRFAFVGNQTPVITQATATPTTGLAPLSVDFSGQATDDEGPLTYRWIFGDGEEAFGQNVTHVYASNGVYSAVLEVSDGENLTTSNPILIAVGNPPDVAITAPPETPQTFFRFGDTITFTGAATDIEDGTLPPAAYQWFCEFVRPTTRHPAFGPTSGTTSIDFEIPVQGQGFSGPVFYECALTVTDSDGLSSVATRRIYPEKVDLTFVSDPPGLTLFFDGLTRTAPFVEDTLINFEHIITAPTTQCLGGLVQNFVGWSDGGAAQHTITVPETNATFTAVYEPGEICAPPSAGMVMHLTAQEGVTANANGVVSLWTDQTGNGNDLTVAPNRVGPDVVPGVLNDHDVVRFNGSNQALGREGFFGLPTGANDRSVFMVVRYFSNNSGGFAYGTASCNQAFGLIVSDTGTASVQGWCPANDFPSTFGVNWTNWVSQAVVYEDFAFNQYVEGVVVNATNHFFSTGDQRIRLGIKLNDNQRVAMEVAEIIVYDRALSSSERQQVESYFSEKYFAGAGGNQPPTAVNDQGNVSLVGGMVTVNVLGNDSDPDGTLDATSVNVVQQPMSGSVSAPDPVTGAITYTHDGSTAVTDSFTYTVRDNDGAISNAATVFITIGPSLCPLPTSGLVLQLETDAGLDLAGSNVLGWLDQSGNGNDFTASGSPSLVTGALNGRDIIRFPGTGTLRRIGGLAGFPAGNADRTLFSVVRYEASGGVSAGLVYGQGVPNAAFGIVANSGGNLAVQGWGAGNDFNSGVVGVQTGWLTQSAVLQTDVVRHYRDGSLIDTDPHVFNTQLERAVIAQEIAELGTSTMDAAAFLVYDRALSEGEREQVEDYLQERYFGAPCTVTNTPPVAAPDSATVDLGLSVAIDILANDSDIDGVIDPASIVIVDPPTHGTIVFIEPMSGLTIYEHDGGDSLSDSFTYTVADEVGGVSNVATVSITIRLPACSDGLDNDGDGLIDFDGGLSRDLDGDGFIDAAFNPATPPVGDPDPNCQGNPLKRTETSAACGLGFELALLLPLIGAWRKRRAASACAAA